MYQSAKKNVNEQIKAGTFYVFVTKLLSRKMTNNGNLFAVATRKIDGNYNSIAE